MDYLKGELNYTFKFDNVYCFYNDNTVINNGAFSGTSSVKQAINGYTTLNNKGFPSMVYLPRDNNSGYLFFNITMDYIHYAVSSYQMGLSLYHYDENVPFNVTSHFVSSSTYMTYVGYQSAGSPYGFYALEYQQYNTGFGPYTLESVFDLSHLEYYFNDIRYEENGLDGHVWNALTSRPDYSLYYNYCLYVSGYQINNVTCNILHASNTTGSSIYNSYVAAYEAGYGTGYGNGYGQGWADGFNSNLDHETTNAFSYISQAFTAVSDVLAIQVLPNVTLGLVFSIPLVFTLILLTFKLVKK